jgi:hypothetical protein
MKEQRLVVAGEEVVELHVELRDIDRQAKQVGGDFVDGGHKNPCILPDLLHDKACAARRRIEPQIPQMTQIFNAFICGICVICGSTSSGHPLRKPDAWRAARVMENLEIWIDFASEFPGGAQRPLRAARLKCAARPDVMEGGHFVRRNPPALCHLNRSS